MKQRTLRHLILLLLTFTGVFHLLVAAFGGWPALRLPLAVFGVIYWMLGYYVRTDVKDGSPSRSRNAIVAAMIVCAVGLGLGGQNYLANGGPLALPIMFAIDVAIIAAGAMWLIQQAKVSK